MKKKTWRKVGEGIPYGKLTKYERYIFKMGFGIGLTVALIVAYMVFALVV